MLHVAGEDDGMVRLVDGSAEAGGAWEYGRLEVLKDGTWTSLVGAICSDRFDRMGAQVACRSLGFATAAQLLVGLSSPFPWPPGSITRDVGFPCGGSESSLANCDSELSNTGYRPYDYPDGVDSGAVALLCTSPSGVPCHYFYRDVDMKFAVLTVLDGDEPKL